MIKASQFQERVKSVQLEKQKRIQSDAKLIEDALNDLYIKVEKNLSLNINPPKFTTISKILEKEIIDNLILNQGYFVDLDKQGNTRIFYSKDDFDNRVSNNSDKRFTYENIKVNEINGKDISELGGTINVNKMNKEETTNKSNVFIIGRDGQAIPFNKLVKESKLDDYEILNKLGLRDLVKLLNSTKLKEQNCR